MKRIGQLLVGNLRLFLLVSALFVLYGFSQEAIELQKLLPSNGAAYDYFGNAVAVNEDIAVVSAWFKDNYTGTAYVFQRNGNSWMEEAILESSGATAYDFFGESVDVFENYVIVGATGDDNLGAAYIFKYENNNWNEVQKLAPESGSAFDRFGASVSMNDSYVVVGADAAQFYEGEVHIYVKNGNTWMEDAVLSAEPSSSAFGCAVNISGEDIIVGAKDSSYAYIYTKSAGNWVLTATLNDPQGDLYDKFGGTVAIDGDLAAVGAIQHQNKKAGTGAAYVFRRQGSSWVQEEKLIAADGQIEDHFGIVSLSGNTIVVGAYQTDNNGEDAGSAYLFQKENNTWAFKEKIYASDVTAGDEFGKSLALSHTLFIVGAPYNNELGDGSGAAYVFEYDPVIGIHDKYHSENTPFLSCTPNPFTDDLTFFFTIEKTSNVRIDILNVSGLPVSTIVKSPLPKGNHGFRWSSASENGTVLPTGIYFVRLYTENKRHVIKVLKR